MSRRFPESNHIEFLPLPCEMLVEVGQNRLKERCYTLQGDAETAKAFENVMRYEADKDPPVNAGGARDAVDAMITEHDGGEDSNDDCCITAVDIRAACPKAFEPAAAAEQAAAAPAAAAKAAAGGAPRHSSKSQASSSAAVAESSPAGAAAGATSGSEEPPSDSEEAPLSKRARLDPAPSKSPAPASSGKRKAPDLSAEAAEIVRAIDAVYEPSPSSAPISAWELLQKLRKRKQFKEDSVLHQKVSQGRLGKNLKGWTIEAIESISARGGDSKTVRCEETTKDNKLVIYCLRCR